MLVWMPEGAFACIVRHMTFDQARESGDIVIIGEIGRIGPEQENPFWREREYEVRVLESLAGSLQPNDRIDVDFIQFIARRETDGTVDCPLLRGSGRESDFRAGDRYLLLLKREEGRFDLYWGSPWIEKRPTEETVESMLVTRFPEPAKTIRSTTNARLTYIIENQGAENLTVNPDLLESAIFVVEIMADGERMYSVPPSVPPVGYKPPTMTLAAGQKRMFALDLNVFVPPLPAGDYDVRINYPGAMSETLRLTVTSGN